MNAAEQANSVDKVSKIATVVNLFKAQFPEATVDLSPWLKNAETAKFDDPDAIDFAFHFPRHSFACQCQTILMQIRLPGAIATTAQRIGGIELSGHDAMGQRWRMNTNSGQFWGTTQPLPEAEQKLTQICRQILRLFKLVVEGSPSER